MVANPADSDGFRSGGRIFAASEIALIREVVATCGGLSRKELANTISELVGWTRANGSLKEAECLLLLVRLEAQGLLRLPAKQQTRPVGSITSIPHTDAGEAGAPLIGRVETFAPVSVERVADAGARQRFRELVGRYHPLGYKVPFGAHLQYLVSIRGPVPTVVGGLQFSVRPGGCKRAIGGSGGTTQPARAIYRRWSITVGSCCCPGSTFKIWRAPRWPGHSGICPPIGRPSMALRRCWWRLSWTRRGIRAGAIGRRIGWRLGRPVGAAAMIASIAAMAAGPSGCSCIG